MNREAWQHITLLFMTMFISCHSFSLLALPVIVFATQDSSHKQLVKLAAADKGVINLDSKMFNLRTSPKRDWSTSIHFTALDRKRKCGPCNGASELHSMSPCGPNSSNVQGI
jgi:hypothetical protein